MLRAPHTRKARVQLILVAMLLFAFAFGVKAVANFVDRQALYTDLRDAISAGNIARVKQFEREGIDWRDINDLANNYSPLHQAIRGGHLEMVRYFVDSGADVFEKTQDGWTAASVAVQWRQLEVLKYLLMDTPFGERIAREDQSIHPIGPYADVELVAWLAERTDLHNSLWGEDAYRILNEAVTQQNLAVVELILRSGAPRGMAAEAWDEGFHRNDAESVRWLALYDKADTPAPLHRAAQLGNAAIVRALLAHGANPHREDGFGKTPLDYARDAEHHEIVELIETHPADH